MSKKASPVKLLALASEQKVRSIDPPDLIRATKDCIALEKMLNEAPNSLVVENHKAVADQELSEIALFGGETRGPGTPISSVLRWDAITGVPYLSVGETIVCHLKVTISPRAPPRLALTIGIPFFNDINSSNDTATVQFTRAAVAVPVASAPALMLLPLLLLLSVIESIGTPPTIRLSGSLRWALAVSRGTRQRPLRSGVRRHNLAN